ncbi:ankyrin repeat domain-containing protein [Rhizobium laguerreae]|uniref:Ankyrin repeat protein n=1 Tax=Rhizobium laguerreae TaxID=1076926 RepID=A0ABR6G1D0_9HYPH|nr:ankyrin repeat domain-containing protein [Rhizobium laguerreae]MBB3160089.1 ankyrin repeat protein [Rhizobium laguerreae]MBY3086978.1 ankyrin repeat domain-containing protein [Rhizobium laguerreae]MBY3099851.1 ankyrin repeat domain-containing protein [Rhizobium laguerreae]MBY3104417.1 ankyrin repeat domain-containing protein [Rhizobium laguerreae]MBY3124225.1 ankyrin repeat domain-containing protein [Rhizobium laguerreae]
MLKRDKTAHTNPDQTEIVPVNIFIATVATLVIGALPAWAGPLHQAAKDGDIARVTQLLDQGSDLSELDEAGEPALIIASLAGHADVVVLLLDRGGDIEIRNKGGLTALHAAAYAGNLEVVKRLVAEGADVNDRKNFYQMSPLHGAAEEGRTDVVAFLLTKSADVEATERNGYTPLTQAGWRAHWDTAKLLMEAGAVCQKAELVGEPLYKECTKRQ